MILQYRKIFQGSRIGQRVTSQQGGTMIVSGAKFLAQRQEIAVCKAMTNYKVTNMKCSITLNLPNSFKTLASCDILVLNYFVKYIFYKSLNPLIIKFKVIYLFIYLFSGMLIKGQRLGFRRTRNSTMFLYHSIHSLNTAYQNLFTSKIQFSE